MTSAGDMVYRILDALINHRELRFPFAIFHSSQTLFLHIAVSSILSLLQFFILLDKFLSQFPHFPIPLIPIDLAPEFFSAPFNLVRFFLVARPTIPTLTSRRSGDFFSSLELWIRSRNCGFCSFCDLDLFLFIMLWRILRLEGWNWHLGLSDWCCWLILVLFMRESRAGFDEYGNLLRCGVVGRWIVAAGWGLSFGD